MSVNKGDPGKKVKTENIFVLFLKGFRLEYSRSSHSAQILFLKPSPLLMNSWEKLETASGNVAGLKFESRTRTQSRTRTPI